MDSALFSSCGHPPCCTELYKPHIKSSMTTAVAINACECQSNTYVHSNAHHVHAHFLPDPVSLFVGVAHRIACTASLYSFFEQLLDSRLSHSNCLCARAMSVCPQEVSSFGESSYISVFFRLSRPSPFMNILEAGGPRSVLPPLSMDTAKLSWESRPF